MDTNPEEAKDDFMRTRDKETIELVSKLNEVIEARRVVEKHEKELKEQIKLIMGSEALLEAGSLMVLLESRSRSDLDKKALTQDLGEDVVLKYTKTTTYSMMSIKPLKLAAQDVG